VLAGQSMGAAAVLLYAQNRPESVNLLLPISQPWLTGKSRGVLWGDEEMAKWKADGFYNKVSKSRGTLRVPYNFYMDLERYDFIQNAGKITARTVLIIGDQDDARRLDWNRTIFDALKCDKELIILPNTPHAVAGTPENAKTFRGALERVFEKDAV
jgi:pimeloyl-ACP methyl ester carboxylesterase